MVNFRKKEIDGQNLLEVLSPKAHVSKYFDMENVENLSDVSIESLDLTGLEEGFVDLEGGWFSVTSFGKHSDNVHCVREAFDTLQSLLSGKSRTLRHIAKVVMYIDNMENYAEMNSQYVTYFGLNPPVRVCVAPEVLCEGCRLVLVCVGQEELQDREYGEDYHQEIINRLQHLLPQPGGHQADHQHDQAEAGQGHLGEDWKQAAQGCHSG